MYKLQKTIKYSAINFSSGLKQVIIYRLNWVDSTYDITVSRKLSRLDGTVIKEETWTQECVSMARLQAMLDTLKERDICHGYYVDVKGVA